MIYYCSYSSERIKLKNIKLTVLVSMVAGALLLSGCTGSAEPKPLPSGVPTVSVGEEVAKPNSIPLSIYLDDATKADDIDVDLSTETIVVFSQSVSNDAITPGWTGTSENPDIATFDAGSVNTEGVYTVAPSITPLKAGKTVVVITNPNTKQTLNLHITVSDPASK